MRLGIISDVHGNLPALKRVLRDIKNKKVDRLLCTGDLVGYYPWPVECTKLIQNSCSDVILGNHDEVVINTNHLGLLNWFNPVASATLSWTKKKLVQKENSNKFAWLRSLEQQKVLQIENRTILLVHGSPDDPWEYIFPESREEGRYRRWLEKWDIVILGHTHQPFTFEDNSKLLLNPGSVGQPRDLNRDASYCVVELNAKNKPRVDFYRVPFPIHEVCEKLADEELPFILCERLRDGW